MHLSDYFQLETTQGMQTAYNLLDKWLLKCYRTLPFTIIDWNNWNNVLI